MEEKLLELEKRIEKIEKREKRRRIIAIVKIILTIIVVAILTYKAIELYNYVVETIKPYKEINDLYNKTNSKIEDITKYFR